MIKYLKRRLLLLMLPMLAVFAMPMMMSIAHANDGGVALAAPAGEAEVTLPALAIDAGPATGIGTSPAADLDTGTVTPGKGTPAEEAITNPSGTVAKIIAAARAGAWRYVAAGALALLMALGVKLNLRIFGKTDRGKATAVMVLSLGMALSTSLATSMPLDLKLASGAVGVAWLAVGGRQWLSRFLWPRDGASVWLAWLKPFLGVAADGEAKRTAVAVSMAGLTASDGAVILLDDGSEVTLSGKALAAAGFARLS